MGYPDNVLADDEQVVVHRHPHVRHLIGAVLALLVVTAVAAFLAGVVNARRWDPTATNVVVAVIGVVWLVAVGWLSLRPFLDWLATHFVVTDRRVMFRRGVLVRCGVDIPLARIVRVGYTRGIVDRILRTGTLVVESAAADPVAFPDIPRVQQIQTLLHQELFDPIEPGESRACRA